MPKFALDNKWFDSAKAQVKDSGMTFEIVKLDPKNFAIFAHQGDDVQEVVCFTKEELKTIWILLTTEK